MEAAVEVDITKVMRAEAAQAGAVLARAFWDDPLFVYVAPDEKQRAAALPSTMTTGVMLGLLGGGEVYRPVPEALQRAVPEALEGAAIWMPPWHPHVTEAEIAEAGGGSIASFVGKDGAWRFATALDAFNQHRANNMGDGQHWYLMVLGVDPDRQGQGIGGRLIAPILARADEERLPVYLETCKERNLAFYRKHGFEVASEGETPDGGLRFWSMKRIATRTN